MSGRKYLTLKALKKRQTLSTKRPIRMAAPDATQTLPASGSVKNQVQEVYDQGAEGSCTANAFCAAYRIVETDKTFNPSRAYVYYKERLVEDGNNPSGITDSGADVEDAVNYVAQYGVCSEASFPYNTANVDVAPPASCDVEAAQHKLGSLVTITAGDLTTIKHTLLSGDPVLLAIGVYQSFESAFTARTGIVKMPNPTNYEDPNDPVDPFLGGHQVLIVGYYDVTQTFTVLNSWGTSWGHGGFFYLPYNYVTNNQLTYELCCIAKPTPATPATPTPATPTPATPTPATPTPATPETPTPTTPVSLELKDTSDASKKSHKKHHHESHSTTSGGSGSNTTKHHKKRKVPKKK